MEFANTSNRRKNRWEKVRENKGDNRPLCRYCNYPLGVHSIPLGVCAPCESNRRRNGLEVLYAGEEEKEEELEDGMVRNGKTYYYLRGLKGVAASRGMNMLEVAELTPYPYGTLKNWSALTNTAPFEKIEVLANVLDTDVRTLIGEKS